MSNADTTIPMAQPPISSSTDAQPQETLLQRGMFDPPVTPGTLGRLDRFEILRLLGEGGMGQVYLAREPRTDTRVAVKILRPQMADDPQSVHRFLTEARHMYRLSHPRILRVLEVSDRKEGPYYVMPYVEGGSLLGQYRPDRPMPTERILAIASQVAEALAHAHAHGLIHRDLKPGNVLLEKDGNAYLTDFGLVRTVFNDSMVDASASHLEGTAPYMSPAVARGEAEDTRCDIYAFGALLYELLTGQPPYTGRTPHIILDQVLKGPPTPLREVNPKASPALVKIAEGCLARELHARYTSMTDVVSDLALAAKGALPLGPHQQEQRRRLPRLTALLAGTLAVAALAGVAVRHFSGASSVTAKTTGVQSPASGGHSQETTVPAEVNSIPFAYTVTNGTVTIVKYTGPGGTVTIPERINGLPVTDVGDYAFADCNLTSVTIPNTVINMSSKEPFFRCKGLVSITVDASNPAYSSEDGVLFDKAKTCLLRYPNNKAGRYVIPDSVTNIGYSAFWRRSGLTSITVPAKVVNIEGWAFAECASLTGIYFTGNAPILGSAALKDLSKATVYYLPGTTGWGKEFGGRPTAVWNGEPMESDDETPYNVGALPSTAKVQGPFAYTVTNGAVTIVKYTGPGGTVSIPDTLGGLPVVDIGYRAFKACSSLINVVIPNGVVSIGAAAFSDCPNLARVVFPASLTNIYRQAFANCPMLTDATLPTGLSRICWGAFSGCGQLSDLTIPSTVTSVEHDAFAWCSANRVTIPASVSSMGANPFRCCGKMTSVVVDEANSSFVNTEGGVLFDKERTSILCYPGGKVGGYTIPNGVTRIGDGAFRGCGGLASVTIPDSLTTIGQWAFHLCTNLTTLVIPGSVTNIGGSTFYACDKLTAVRFLGDAPIFGSGIFDLAKKVTVYYRPGTKGWGPTFGGRPTAVWNQDAQVPYTYTTNNGAITFTKYTGPGGDVTIPSTINGLSVTGIGHDVFWTCDTATSVTIPASVNFIASNPFATHWDKRSRLLSFLVDVANTAFSNSADGVLFNKDKTCLVSFPGGKAGSYVIPNSVTGITDYAFARSANLTYVTIPNSVVHIGNYAFCGCAGLANVYFKGNAPDLDKDVFEDSKVTVYYRPGAKGWGPTFGGRPTAVWDGEVPAADAQAETDIHDFACVAENGGVAIVKYTGESNAIVIPSKVSGLPVTTIKDTAFQNCPSVTSVVIPAHVTSIASGVFMNCSNLISILVDALNPVYACSADGVLFNKDKSCIVCYPRGKTGNYAIPKTVNYIGNDAFKCCENLTAVTIPNSVTQIAGGAFAFSTRLTSMTIPASVTSIEAWAFSGCSRLNSLQVDDANPVFSSDSNGVVFNKDKTRLVRYPSGKAGNYVIPDNVVQIGADAFEGSTGLTSVTIPESVTVIEVSTFKSCSNLVRISIPNSVTRIGSMAFEGCANLSSVSIPNSVNYIDGCAFRACTSLASLAIPDSVTGIGGEAFNGCTNLATVKIGNGVTNIADWAFVNCSKLANILIPKHVRRIGIGTFSGCRSLASVALPDDLNSIGGMAFDGCVSLASLTIPAGVTHIEDCAFRGCASLPSVTIPDGITTIKGHWGGGTFNGCATLKNVTIPDNVRNVGVGAFMGCTNLTHVTIGNNVTNIEGWAFGYCASLTSIHFKGDAPSGTSDVSIFTDNGKVTVYYRSGTQGWGKEFGGRPTKECKP